MKKILPFLLVIFLCSGCKDDPNILFEMAYERSFTIPAGLNTFQTHYFYLRDIPLGNYLSSNGVTASELMAINPGAARLTTIDQGLSDYSFIRNVSIQIFTDDEANAREIFWRPEIPLNTGERLDVFATLIDAKQFFENTKFNVFVKLQLQAVPQQTIDTRFQFSFLAK